MNYICIFPWRKLRILYTGLMGILPKPPTDEVGLPINQGTADSLRTLCEILSPLPELCRGWRVRLQVPSRNGEVLYVCFMLYTVVAFEATELL